MICNAIIDSSLKKTIEKIPADMSEDLKKEPEHEHQHDGNTIRSN